MVVLFVMYGKSLLKLCTGGLGAAAMFVCSTFEKNLTSVSHVIQIGLRKRSEDVWVMLKPDHGNISFDGA